MFFLKEQISSATAQTDVHLCFSVALIIFRKVPKFSDARKFDVIHLKFKQRGQS